MQTSIEEQKKLLRKQMQAQRSKLSPQEHATKSQAICRNLLNSGWLAPREESRRYSGTVTFLTYMPFGSEVDITPLMEWGWTHGCNVIVPRVETASSETKLEPNMSLHQITGYNDLESGAWGIREPKQTVPIYKHLISIDVILIPGIAFDKNGGRIGYGGGYYDRLLERFGQQGLQLPTVIAPAFDLQLVSSVPMEKHDFRVDHIVSEFTIL